MFWKFCALVLRVRCNLGCKLKTRIVLCFQNNFEYALFNKLLRHSKKCVNGYQIFEFYSILEKFEINSPQMSMWCLRPTVRILPPHFDAQQNERTIVYICQCERMQKVSIGQIMNMWNPWRASLAKLLTCSSIAVTWSLSVLREGFDATALSMSIYVALFECI